MTTDDWKVYVDTIKIAKENGEWDKAADLHNKLANDIHWTAVFLPWHRLFLVNVEATLQKINPKFFFPYIQETDGEQVANTLLFPKSNEACPNTRDWAYRYDLPSNALIATYYSTSVRNRKGFESWASSMEVVHGYFHVNVGSTMSSMRSPHDPLFYSHHAYYDYEWSKAQVQWGERYPQVGGLLNDGTSLKWDTKIPGFNNVFTDVYSLDNLCIRYLPRGEPVPSSSTTTVPASSTTVSTTSVQSTTVFTTTTRLRPPVSSTTVVTSTTPIAPLVSSTTLVTSSTTIVPVSTTTKVSSTTVVPPATSTVVSTTVQPLVSSTTVPARSTTVQPLVSSTTAPVVSTTVQPFVSSTPLVSVSTQIPESSSSGPKPTDQSSVIASTSGSIPEPSSTDYIVPFPEPTYSPSLKTQEPFTKCPPSLPESWIQMNKMNSTKVESIQSECLKALELVKEGVKINPVPQYSGSDLVKLYDHIPKDVQPPQPVEAVVYASSAMSVGVSSLLAIVLVFIV